MRWFAYFILAYVMLGLQLGLGAHVQYRGISPNLVLLVVVFISLNAPRDEALLGSFLLGAMQDLVTLQPMGLYAFSYGIVSMLVTTVGQLAYREHPLTQLFMTLIGGTITSTIVMIHGWVHPLGPARTDGIHVIPAVRQSPRALLVCVVYTAILAPIIIGILQRMQRMFGFQPSGRRRSRGGER
ncbi:MAG TPA: rod shape-determining protein MreD [Tepidisphaeraceae bacterium]|nr:rod shape-determining protein MreD [Tepidisphaeraceae bacterium]